MSPNSFRMRVLNVGKIITQGQGEMKAFDIYSVQYVWMNTAHFLQTKALTAECRL
jgi:hypothetical protein